MPHRLTRLVLLALGTSATVVASLTGCAGGGVAVVAPTRESIGRNLFNDVTLSVPAGQSCASCHQAIAAFADPRQDQPTSEGATAGLFGGRQTPTAKYMAFSPKFGIDPIRFDYVGGQFWDGRAADLKEQAHFPLLNPAEMNNASKEAIIAKVKVGPSGDAMRQLYGPDVFSNTDYAMDYVAECIAAFESTQEFAPFSSKFDRVLQGKAKLNLSEARGLALFNSKAGCASCHTSAVGPNGEAPLFTDFSYSNLGVPKNPANPFYGMPAAINPDGAAFVDHGLKNTTGRSVDDGRMKTPTLRNIAITAPYMHNGVFKTLEEVMRFYNARDLGGFDPPEVPANVNHGQLGDLKLKPGEIEDIVAFMKTLTDGWRE